MTQLRQLIALVALPMMSPYSLPSTTWATEPSGQRAVPGNFTFLLGFRRASNKLEQRQAGLELDSIHSMQ